jgi:hypothetical protein
MRGADGVRSCPMARKSGAEDNRRKNRRADGKNVVLAIFT